ncbi:MAG TPA: ComEC/Rec2 family competence protein [Opitutus sp.]|nr:ComEC/Rec2 family competence protein [Opitutus sp.]
MNPRCLGHRAPLLWLVLPMMAGLAFAHRIGIGQAGWLLTGAALAAAGALRAGLWRPRGFVPLIALAMFLAGWASYALHRPKLEAWKRLPPREARLGLRVLRTFASVEAGRVSGIARVEQTEAHLRDLVGQRVYFSLQRTSDSPALVLRSSLISAIGVLALLPADPPANSFDGYLADSGVNFRFGRGRLLAEQEAPTVYRRFCARQADRLAAILGAGVEQKQPELVGVLRAMMLGRQSELTDEQETLFRRSGTMHVFSISGLHIAVIAGGLHALLLLLRLPRSGQFAIGLGALWLYVDITGTVPSAVRAFWMVALVQSSLLWRTPRNPLSALATSALLVLLVAPLQLFSASFQMSYGIVAALLLLGLPLAETWQARLALFRDLPPVSWRWHHRLRDGGWRAMLTATALGMAASLVSAVTGLMFFNLFTPAGLVVNLWLIPGTSLALLAGFVSLVCGLVGFTAGSVIANHAAVLVLWLIDRGVRMFADLPGAWFEGAFQPPALGSVALVALLAAMALGYARHWRGWNRGYWTPFVIVAVALAAGVKFA